MQVGFRDLGLNPALAPVRVRSPDPRRLEFPHHRHVSVEQGDLPRGIEPPPRGVLPWAGKAIGADRTVLVHRGCLRGSGHG